MFLTASMWYVLYNKQNWKSEEGCLCKNFDTVQKKNIIIIRFLYVFII